MVRINILVIDDEYKAFQALLRDHFTLIEEQRNLKLNFDFVFSDTMEEGKKIIKDPSSLDLVILDLLFKGKTGEIKSFELLRFMKENYPQIPVLMLSAAANIADLQKAGFDHLYRPDGFVSKNESINKPVPDYEIIFDSVFRLLRQFGRINTETGILITHGTDTMAWAFAILRYGLYNLRTNVIITGSQLPLEGTFSSSDAIGNMLTSVKLLNMLVPPNIIQVFNDGLHMFNKNLVKVKKWSVDAFYGNSFGRIEAEELKIDEDDVYKVADDKRTTLDKLYFIKTGGTIDSGDSGGGLSANRNYTIQYLENLKTDYFREFETIPINPKDSSFFNPADWTKMLNEIAKTSLSDADQNFDWNILTVIQSPFQTKEIYGLLAEELIRKYSGAVILGYGAGNVNIIGSCKTESTREYSIKFAKTFGASELETQKKFSLISFLEEVERHNSESSENYKFIVISSQVPVDNSDIDYEAGRIPLYYGALPSGDLSYPEAQTKLAFILGHKQLIQDEARLSDLSYIQLVKSCFLCGIKFNKKANKKIFLEITEKECGCEVFIHPRNVFVKNRFEDGLKEIISLYRL